MEKGMDGQITVKRQQELITKVEMLVDSSTVEDVVANRSAEGEVK